MMDRHHWRVNRKSGGEEGTEQWDTAVVPGLQGWHGFLLRKAGQRFTEQAEQALVHLNITLRQFGVLNVVDSEPGINQRMVGQTLRIDRTTIVGLVDDLEQKDLLERRRGADRRTFALYLTDRGTVCLRDAET